MKNLKRHSTPALQEVRRQIEGKIEAAQRTIDRGKPAEVVPHFERIKADLQAEIDAINAELASR